MRERGEFGGGERDGSAPARGQAQAALDAVHLGERGALALLELARLRRALLGVAPVLVIVAVALLTATFYPSRPEVVMESMIIKHQRNLPLEITGGPEVVRSWFDGKVPFAVPPPRVEPIASLRGGRISQLGDREAAYLQYEQRGQRISVFVFDPSGLRLQAPRRAVIHNREVFIQGTRGYHIAVFQDRDLGYAIAGSVDEPEFIQFVSAIMRSP